MRPKLIISGAQTGADEGGLLAAEHLGIPMTGYCPLDCTREDGHHPELISRFRLMETNTRYDYSYRTKLNVEYADATLIFGRRSVGSNLTERLCQDTNKPFLWIPYTPGDMVTSANRIRLWLARVKPETLNIAGNRESKSPGIGEWVCYTLIEALR